MGKKYCLCGCGEEIPKLQYLRFKWIDFDHRNHWLKTSDRDKVSDQRNKRNLKK